MRLLDKTVLITGASKGIGRALAVGMAGEGARIVVNFQSDRAGADATAASVRELGREALVIQADVGEPAQTKRLFSKIKSAWGGVDVLVNNAAITGWGNLFAMSEEQWDRVMNTNLKAAFFASRHAAEMMRERGGGSIINVSTNCAMLGVKNLVAYAASKGGVHALTLQLAVELAPLGIRVNTFAPGPTIVDRNLEDDPDYDRTWGAVVPLGRAARPEEMVGPAVFLASADSSYMTGQVFCVDGGWSVAGRTPDDYFNTTMEKRTNQSGADTPHE